MCAGETVQTMNRFSTQHLKSGFQYLYGKPFHPLHLFIPSGVAKAKHSEIQVLRPAAQRAESQGQIVMNTNHTPQPAALLHFKLMPADQQAIAIRRLLRSGWSVDDAARVTGQSVNELVVLLNAFPERI